MHVMDHLPRIGRSGTEKTKTSIFKELKWNACGIHADRPACILSAYHTDKGILHLHGGIKMYFEKTILCGIKALIDKKNGACSYSCSNKTCYEELNTFLTNSKIEETYKAIVDIFSNSIKDSSSYPSFTKGF